MSVLLVGNDSLKLEEIEDVAVRQRKVKISPQAIKKIKKSRDFLNLKVAEGGIHYGINTGFGILSNVRIPDHQIKQLQLNLIRSHATGVGDWLSDSQVRGMLLLRAHNLALGYSGVSERLVQQFIYFLNYGIHPLVPEKGSVGASGDLAPLAHLALPLIGEGQVRVDGKVMSGAQALKKFKIEPLELGPKEGLALTNGTQFMTSVGTLALLELEYLYQIANLTGALSLEALRGTSTAFDSKIHEVRPHPGQVKTAQLLRKILLKGGKSEIAKDHKNCGRVQDPYSLRCMPQVHGACYEVMSFTRGVLEREVNSVTDNPIVFPEAKAILSGGNFHGQIVSMSLDAMALSAAELASISEQRIEKLVNPVLSGLPPFLIQNGGVNSGFMIVQVSAASLVSENKTLCHPASVDSIPTSADKEDHVSMGAWAACKALRVIENTRRVLAMEILAATQGIDFLRPLRTSQILEGFYSRVRKKIPKIKNDRAFYKDIQVIEKMIEQREFSSNLE